MNSQGLQKNKKNKVVLKLKRKREDVPEEAIVVEERAKKSAKLDLVEAFSKMGFQEEAKCKTLFRYFGSESEPNTFDLCARLKEIRQIESAKLPVIYPKKKGVIFEQKKKENKNTMPGLVTNKEASEGYEIIEINHSSLMTDDAHEYHYYYMDEVTNIDKLSNDVLTIQFESFLLGSENADEYDEDEIVYSGDEEEIDYPSTDSEGGINSWERGSSDDDWNGAGPQGHESSEDEYGEEYDY